MTQAKVVGYWDNLKAMPDEGPFVLCGGPVVANTPRIEQVRGEDGVGCPVVLSLEMYQYMEDHGIPCGYAGACRLNELYAEGAFEWRDHRLYPKKTTSHVSKG